MSPYIVMNFFSCDEEFQDLLLATFKYAMQIY